MQSFFLRVSRFLNSHNFLLIDEVNMILRNILRRLVFIVLCFSPWLILKFFSLLLLFYSIFNCPKAPYNDYYFVRVVLGIITPMKIFPWQCFNNFLYSMYLVFTFRFFLVLMGADPRFRNPQDDSSYDSVGP